jgi:hypothetical protein
MVQISKQERKAFLKSRRDYVKNLKMAKKIDEKEQVIDESWLLSAVEDEDFKIFSRVTNHKHHEYAQ